MSAGDYFRVKRANKLYEILISFMWRIGRFNSESKNKVSPQRILRIWGCLRNNICYIYIMILFLSFSQKKGHKSQYKFVSISFEKIMCIL